MMFAIVALSLSIATSWTKPNPYKEVINKCVCMYVCMYVSTYVCVYVFEIEMRGWEDLCQLSQQTSGYMLLYHTPVCAHISRVPIGLIAIFFD